MTFKNARIDTAKMITGFVLLKDQSQEKPDFVEKNTELSAYWDQNLEEIKKIPDSILITLKKLFSATPKSLVDTYNLTQVFINKLTQAQVYFESKTEKFFPHFSRALESKLKELEPLVKKRMECINLLDKTTVSSKAENREISLNNDCLRQIASYLPITDIKNLLKASLFASKSKSANVDLDTLTPTNSCSRSSSC